MFVSLNKQRKTELIEEQGKKEKERKVASAMYFHNPPRTIVPKPTSPRPIIRSYMPAKHELAQYVVDVEYYHSEHWGYFHLVALSILRLASSDYVDTLSIFIHKRFCADFRSPYGVM